MKLIRHGVGGLVIFTILVVLMLNFFEPFKEDYNLNEIDVKNLNGTTGNIFEQLKAINIIEGVTAISNGIILIKPPSGTQFDILGGLASVAIGVLKTITGLITLPFEIIGIIFEYYTGLPSIIAQLGLLIVVYVGFILLSGYLRKDV